MIPIKQLLDKIRWDEEFGRGEFRLGYYDRVQGQVLVVPFQEIGFPGDGNFFFEVRDSEGEIHTVPLHRVRQVFRNGELIWNRDGA